jgi:hypothetical protein
VVVERVTKHRTESFRITDALRRIAAMEVRQTTLRVPPITERHIACASARPARLLGLRIASDA